MNNEIGAPTNLCIPGSSEYVVPVPRHGPLANSSSFRLDMPLWLQILDLIYDSPHGIDNHWRAYELPDLRAVSDVARGLWYIHNLGETHPDLQPSNGMSHVYIV